MAAPGYCPSCARSLPCECVSPPPPYPQTIMYKGVGNLLVTSPRHHEEVKRSVDAMHTRMDREESERG